jgi:hypothetical protein
MDKILEAAKLLKETAEELRKKDLQFRWQLEIRPYPEGIREMAKSLVEADERDKETMARYAQKNP